MNGNQKIDDQVVNDYLMFRDSQQQNYSASFDNRRLSSNTNNQANIKPTPDVNSFTGARQSQPLNASNANKLIREAQRTVANRQALQMQQSSFTSTGLGYQAFSPDVQRRLEFENRSNSRSPIVNDFSQGRPSMSPNARSVNLIQEPAIISGPAKTNYSALEMNCPIITEESAQNARTS